MKITIIGAGNMARGIATRALAGGHTITVTTKDPGKAVRLVDELRGRATGEGRMAAADASAVDTADIVVSSPSRSTPPSSSPAPTETGSATK
ncbi:NAD(P)-binding domain-containing protein [Streptomyces phaeochromogenes]|jgi:3-hydroxyisobutyrate dehydrogenase-like beta-hydroxyacid dehydrogenase|nr:NAD(P)-binding domain-containing protein [Streptomyces phaeochromogenes]